MRDIIAECRRAVQSAKECAFNRWVDSGYKDVAAYDEFIRHYEALNRRKRSGD